ncbi:hypothetical protein XENTR_v10017877 [Xenopus tropicalis]|nr:hypothetical protein XENTR_v10017877 [Xenopus tropicalis]
MLPFMVFLCALSTMGGGRNTGSRFCTSNFSPSVPILLGPPIPHVWPWWEALLYLFFFFRTCSQLSRNNRTSLPSMY